MKWQQAHDLVLLIYSCFHYCPPLAGGDCHLHPQHKKQLFTGKHNLRSLLFTFTLLGKGVGAARQTKPLPTSTNSTALLLTLWEVFRQQPNVSLVETFYSMVIRKCYNKEVFEWEKSLFSVDSRLLVSSAQQSVKRVIYSSNCWNRDINWQIRHQEVKMRQYLVTQPQQAPSHHWVYAALWEETFILNCSARSVKQAIVESHVAIKLYRHKILCQSNRN